MSVLGGREALVHTEEEEGWLSQTSRPKLWLICCCMELSPEHVLDGAGQLSGALVSSLGTELFLTADAVDPVGFQQLCVPG